MSADDNIIPFDPARKAKPVFRIGGKKNPAPCQHTSVQLDHGRRALVCEFCHGLVDPFEFLVGVHRYAGRFEAWYEELRKRDESMRRQVKQLEAQAKKLAKQRDALKREVEALSRQRRMDFGLPEHEIEKMKKLLK
jgi:uncharacterized protein YlxW (UPF0749 family)